jgi:hypothetical protein
MPTVITQPLAEPATIVVQRAEALAHLRAAEPLLAPLSDYMAYLTRTMIEELEIQAQESRP